MLEAIAIGVMLGGLLTVAVELLHLFRVPNLPAAFFSMTPPGTARRMWGNLNQPNHVASYLAFGLAACLFLGQRFPRWRMALAAIGLSLLLGMALTISRVTWLHVAVVGGTAGLAWSANERGIRRWIVACVPLLALAVAYQCCGWLVSYANLLWHLDLPSSLGERMQEGAGLRPLLWKHAWHMFRAHPWLGAGWGDYAWNQYVQTDVLGPVEMSLNAHNIVLDLLAKAGLAGLLAVALPLLGLAWAAWKRSVTPALAFLYAVILVMGVHSMLEYPLHYLYFLLPFAFALGYADERTLRMPSGPLAWVLTGTVTVCAGVLTARMWGDYASVERLYYLPADVQRDVWRQLIGERNVLIPYATLAAASNANVTPETARTMAVVERNAVQFYPGPNTVQRYALALAYEGKADEALVQVRRLYNHYWTSYADQSALLAQACGRQSEALKTFCVRLRSEGLLSNPN